MQTQQQTQRSHQSQGHKRLPWKHVRRLIYTLVLIMFFFFIGGAAIWILNQLGVVQGPWSDKLFTILTGLGAGTAAFLSLLGIIQFILSLIPTDTPSSPSTLTQQAEPYTITHDTTLDQHVSLWNIPYQRNPFFTGREEVLTHIHDRLCAGEAPGLTQPQAITGLGGVGKTQIAVEYAYRYRDAYRYVLWVRAATRDTFIADFALIATLLHLPEKDEPDQRTVIDTVKQWLITNTGWLLILDNADDIELASDFLPTGGTGHILLTTRTQIVGTIANRIEVETMNKEEGILLILRRAKVIAPDASLEQATETDQAQAETIVKELDALPLALDQAGAYIDETKCGLSGYIDLYRMHRQDLLQRRSTLSTDHPESIAATFSLSFQKVEKINPAAAELLRLCAFLYPDAIPEEVITEGASELGNVLGPVAINAFQLNGCIEELRKFSLVRRDPDEHTLMIHRLVQVILIEEMPNDTQRLWAERSVKAVNRAFPDVVFEAWPHCQRLLPQAQACAALIRQWDLAFPEAARLLNQAGLYLQDHAQYPETELLLQQALVIRKKVLGPEDPDIAQSLNDLGYLYNTLGKYNQAEPFLERALAIREKVLGPEDPDTAASLTNLGYTYYMLSNDEQAELLLKRAVAIREKVLGPEDPKTAISLNNLAFLYQRQGKYEQAELLWKQALEIRKKVLPLDHPYTSNSFTNLALLYQEQGKYEQAEPLLQQALAIREKVLGSNNLRTAKSLTNLGHTYYMLGKYNQAEPLLQQALAIREKVLGPEDPDTATVLEDYAFLLRKMKRMGEAMSLETRAKTIRARQQLP